jgi:phosphomannomutase
MRETNAIFAGEHSGHYYYRDFFRAESGVLTALIVLSLLSHENKKLSDMVDELSVYPASGEINFTVSDIPRAVAGVRSHYKDASTIDDIDGMSVWYKNFWFNVRASKTEPLLRLNVEADSDDILKVKSEEIIAVIERMGGKRTE